MNSLSRLFLVTSLHSNHVCTGSHKHIIISVSLRVGRVCVSADQHAPSAGLRSADSPGSDVLWLRTVDQYPAAIWSSSLASAPDPCSSARLQSVSIKGGRKAKRFVFIPHEGTQSKDYCVLASGTSIEYTVFPSVRGSQSSHVTEFSVH